MSVPPGTTILEPRACGYQIPTICYHDTTANALCRICVVEVEGARTLVPSCVAQVSEGMKVQTNPSGCAAPAGPSWKCWSPRVDLSEAPEILQMLRLPGNPRPFPEAEEREPLSIDDNPMYIRDYSKCILCWRCVQVCAEDAQYTYAINFSGRGYETQISTFFEIPMPETTCVFCGQCVGVCPTGALKPKRQWLLEKGHTADEIMDMTRSERRSRRRRSIAAPMRRLE